MIDEVERILFSEEQLAERTQELAEQITRDYAGKDLVAAIILKGSYMFAADLTRRIGLPMDIDFMSVSSYQGGTTTSGQVEIKKDLSKPIEGKDLLLIEDILDSGTTLYYLRKVLQARNPASIRICTLLDKPDRRSKPVTADYCGFTVPDAFVVGYGLDYDQHFRNLPYIGILKPYVYGG